MKVNQQIIPPNGWHFFEGSVKIEGETMDRLLENMKLWRIRNHRPIGDPFSEVTDYICTKWPHFCIRDSSDFAKIPKPDAGVVKVEKLPADRVANWAAIAAVSLGNKKLVDSEVAEARAKVCAACPRNILWRAGGCSSCQENTANVLFFARRGKDVSCGAALRMCEISGQDNRTAVWFPIEALNITEEHKKSLPEQCWKLKE